MEIFIIIVFTIIITTMIIGITIGLWNHFTGIGEVRRDPAIVEFSVEPSIVCRNSSCPVRVQFQSENLGSEQEVLLSYPIDNGRGERRTLTTRDSFDQIFEPILFNIKQDDFYHFDISIDNVPGGVPPILQRKSVTVADDSEATFLQFAMLAYQPEVFEEETLSDSFSIGVGISSTLKSLSFCKGMQIESITFESVSVESSNRDQDRIVNLLSSLPVIITIVEDSDVILNRSISTGDSIDLDGLLIGESMSVSCEVQLPEGERAWPMMTTYQTRFGLKLICPS